MDKKELSKKLAENLGYYIGADTRCTKDTTTNNNGCFYNGKSVKKETEGCFVGRMLPESTRQILDKKGLGGWFEVVSDYKDGDLKDVEIPKWMIDNCDTMTDFQVLHDNNCYWDKDFNLTFAGRDCLRSTIEQHGLVLEDFEKFL